jgi:uncharacterized membrane protein
MTLPYYPQLNDSNVKSILDVVIFDNALTHGLFVPVILLMLWSITFALMYFVDKGKSFLASGFLVFIISTFLWGAGLLEAWYVILTFVMTVFGVGYMIYSPHD